jgi:hypothetical protein
VPDDRLVLFIAVGVGMIGVGLFAALRPEKSVELSYRWRRWWIRMMSLGRLETPQPPFSDQTARRLMVVVGIVLVVVGIGLTVSGVVSIST